MPQKPEIEPQNLEEKLKKWPMIFNDHQSLKSEKDPIWANIKKSLNLKMCSKSLYLYLYNDRHHCKSNLLTFFKINEVRKKIVTNNSESENSMNCEKIRFEITVPISLIIDENKRKQKNWTDVLHMAMWEKKRLPCSYNFKNSWLTNDGFKFNGYCTDCGSEVHGQGEVMIDQEKYKFEIVTYATFEIKHTKKRKLQGKRREEIKKILLTKTAGEYREDELAQMNVDYEPPHLNTSSTLSKAREQGLDEEFGYIQYKGLSISNKKFLNFCSVRKLCLSPFYLWYWSDKQLSLWNSLQKQILPLSFDATGGLVKKYSYYPNGNKSKTLFMYVMVIGFNGKIIPLLQAILSIHDVTIIQELLCHWIECGAQVPKEIVTDGSLALQNAISLAFNKMTFKNYNLQCFKILSDESNILPICYLRLDVAHLLNTVRRWNCFKLSNITVIDFYLRSIGYLIQVEKLPEFEKIVMCIVVVANSETAAVNSLCYECKTMLLEIFKTYKCTLDQFNNLAEQSDTSLNQKENEEKKVVDNSKNDLILFIDNIFKKALSKCQSNEEISDKGNFYFCSEFTNNFQNLCYTFPTWTNSMQKLFSSPNKVGTSSRSEAYFKELKKRVPRPILVQKYVLKDNKKIAALTNFAFSRLTKTSDREVHIANEQDIFNVNLESLHVFEINDINASSEQEKFNLSTASIIQDFFPIQSSSPLNNTKVQNLSTSRTFSDMDIKQFSPPQNPTFVDNMEIQLINTNSTNESLKFSIPVTRNLIKNGNRIKMKFYCINQSIMQLCFKNTCPFDSIFELFTSAYIQNSNFATSVDENKHNNTLGTLYAIINYHKSSFQEDLLYESRAQLLYPRYKSERRSTESVIHCEDNIGRAFEYFMKSFPSLYQNVNCPSCSYKYQKNIYSTSLSCKQYHDQEGIRNLQIVLDSILADKILMCQKCHKKTASASYKLSSYFLLDLEYLHERKNLPVFKLSVDKEICFKTNFHNVPSQLILKSEKFELVGIISFEGDPNHETQNTDDRVIIHYKTYIFSPSKEWILFDSLKENVVFLKEAPCDKIAFIMYCNGWPKRCGSF